jgi:hypothetical protein
MPRFKKVRLDNQFKVDIKNKKTFFSLYFFRTFKEEESSGAGAEEKVQEEFRLLGLREEDKILDPEDREEAVVLLVRHRPRLLQHFLRGCGTLQSTQVAH